MKRYLLVCVVLLSAAALAQQTKSPVSDALRTMLTGREKNMIAAFEEMPADKFGYYFSVPTWEMFRGQR